MVYKNHNTTSDKDKQAAQTALDLIEAICQRGETSQNGHASSDFGPFEKDIAFLLDSATRLSRNPLAQRLSALNHIAEDLGILTKINAAIAHANEARGKEVLPLLPTVNEESTLWPVRPARAFYNAKPQYPASLVNTSNAKRFSPIFP